MIGSYGRHALGGRAGGTINNKNVHTISPKGGTLKRVKQLGSSRVAKRVGSLKRS